MFIEEVDNESLIRFKRKSALEKHNDKLGNDKWFI